MNCEIRCRKCGNDKFELNFTGMNANDNHKRSIIAICRCGRRVEYRGVAEAIEMSAWEVIP